MERYLPDEIVQLIIYWKEVKDADIERRKRYVEYRKAKRLYQEKNAITPSANKLHTMMLTGVYLDLTLDMRTQVRKEWFKTLGATREQLIQSRIYREVWREAKTICKLTLLNVA